MTPDPLDLAAEARRAAQASGAAGPLVQPSDPLDLAAEARRQPADRWRWNSTDTGLQAAFGLTMLGDYLQTRKITRAGKEINPIIGSRGQNVPPSVYFPATMALHTAAMRALPRPYRNIAQGLSIGFEGGVVGRNAKLGWGFQW
jgi:hypothetical protein